MRTRDLKLDFEPTSTTEVPRLHNHHDKYATAMISLSYDNRTTKKPCIARPSHDHRYCMRTDFRWASQLYMQGRWSRGAGGLYPPHFFPNISINDYVLKYLFWIFPGMHVKYRIFIPSLPPLEILFRRPWYAIFHLILIELKRYTFKRERFRIDCKVIDLKHISVLANI